MLNSKRTFHILGRVIASKDQREVSGVRVEAWDKDLIASDLVGSAITDSHGAFRIEFDVTYFKELFLDRRPDLYFKVFRNGMLIKSTEDSVLWNVETEETDIIIEVDVPIDEKAEPFVVRGQVLQADGNAFMGGTVRAFDKDLPSLNRETLLGEAATDKEGRYEISYTQELFRKAERKSADLLVRVYNREPSPVASSQIIFNAQSVETVDLVIGGAEVKGLSEYERYLLELAPSLESIQIADLTEEDIAFLSGETGINSRHLSFLVLAAGLAQQTGIAAEVFYGLFRENLPTALLALLSQGSDIQRTALKAALQESIIPARLALELDGILASLKALLIQSVIQPPDEDEGTPLGALLDISLPAKDKQITFLTLYTDHRGNIEEFWEKLREHPEFRDGDQIEQLQFTLQLGALTGDNVPLVQSVRQNRGINSTLDLTELDLDAWTNLVRSTSGANAERIPSYIKGATPEEKLYHYAQHIVETLKSAFPTKYVQLGMTAPPEVYHGLLRRVLELNPDFEPGRPLPDNLNWGTITTAEQDQSMESLVALRDEIKLFPEFDYKGALSTVGGDGEISQLSNPIRQGVARFLGNASEFDFGKIHIDTYIAERGGLAFQGIEESQKPAVINQLKTFQRVYQVVPRYEAMSSLMSAGLDSAQSIASLPEEVFVEHFGQQVGGDFYARVIYESADNMRNQALVAFGSAAEAASGVFPRVIGSPSPSIRSMTAYADLFGRFNLCECEHCRSVYSPAAYFVDLLEFLNPRTGFWLPRTTPLDVLRRRRPDLEHIQLTCENTNTTIPYIDLVNEVLETYIAFNSTLDHRITDDLTPFTSSELMSNPQHINATAYGALKREVYPPTLPFNRDLEVVRAYMEHLDSSRYEVMETFQKNPAAAGAEAARECEYLKISPEERTALTSGPVHRLYGFTDSEVNWQESLASVEELLNRTGLRYTDLEELLKTRFINPASDLTAAGAVVILALNETCDPHEQRLRHRDGSPLSFEEWARLQKFTRLWRKLGWSMLDVDRALTALAVRQVAQVDDGFLISLGQAVRLQRDLNLPLADMLSFWANIDTLGDDTRTRHENSLFARLFQNREVRVLSMRDGATSPPDPFQLNATGSDLNVSGQLSDVEAAILAAMRISATDLAIIRKATGLEDHPEANPPTLAPLNLANLSSLYRYAVLAKALRLQVKDLISYMRLTGMEPFSVVAPDGTRTFKTNLTIQFVEKVNKVLSSRFSVAQLNYLYRHVAEPAGGIAPAQADIASGLATIRTGLKKIVEDAGSTEPARELFLKELAVVMDGAGTDTAMKLLDGTAVHAASLPTPPSGVVFPTPGHTNISYDGVAHKLRFIGAMTTRDRAALEALAPTNTTYLSALAELFSQPRNFISRRMGKFLDPTEAESRLIEDAATTTEDKYAYVLTRLLAYLSRSLVLQALSDALTLDAAITETLLTSILKSRAMTGEPIVEDFLALRDGALMASYFDTADWTGVPSSRVDSTINFGDGRDWPDPALVRESSSVRVKERFSVRWTGKLLAPSDENYTFHVRADGRVRLSLDGEVLLDVSAPHDTEVRASRLLKAGQLYALKLEYAHTAGAAVAQLLWDCPSIQKELIPQGQLYLPTAYDAYMLLHKAALLINTFKMTDREVDYLSNHGWDFVGVNTVPGSVRMPFDLNRLTLEFSDPFGLNSTFFSQWEELCELFALRDALPRGEASLIDVFGIAGASAPSTTLSRATIDKLKAVTNWDDESLDELRSSSGFNLTDAHLKNERALRRVWACLQLSKRLGVSVKQLFDWAENAPDGNQAQEVKNAVKAKYEDDQWSIVAKSLNDDLREKQRSALVAHILTLPAIIRAGVRDSNQLFEYFLIDVEMSACMATSRIKQAISSVQLFIQRCFMNLEAGVAPSSLSAKHWKWMKNYRIWEANRKVFLYPENWIEPELRDDKSPFFRDLENELMQNDVTQDTAESAFLNYLDKLDEVARLDIRGMYWEYEAETAAIWEDSQGSERSLDPEERADILHVFGRTHGTPPIYYYRKFVNRRTWTAWERVQVDLEGDHLIPVVYNRRLFVFWPIFTEKQESPPAPPAPPGGAALVDIRPVMNEPPKYLEIQLAWSEYKNGKWSAKKISPQKIRTPRYYVLEYRINFFFDTYEENGDLVVRCMGKTVINLFDTRVYALGTFRFSDCEGRTKAISSMSTTFDESADDFFPPNSYMLNQAFESRVGYAGFALRDDRGGTNYVLGSLRPAAEERAGRFGRFNVVYSHQYAPYVLQAPFFYQDDQRTYFVTPEQVADTVNQLTDLNRVIPAFALKYHPSVSKDQGSGIVASANSGGQQIAQAMSSIAPLEIKQTTERIWNQITICPGDQSLDNFDPDRSPTTPLNLKLRFHTFYHPQVCEFIKALKRKGIPGLLSLENQQLSDFTQNGEHLPGDNSLTTFRATYNPTRLIDLNYPKEDVGFEGGGYSLYNWEVFFHAPLLIATRLSKNQRFEEAREWFHYIFDPTNDSDDDVPRRFWKVLPFYLNDHVAQDQIGELLRLLSYRGNDPATLARKEAVHDQVDQWKDDPFNPHLIARLRITAFQKTVVMKYIDNLIAWGDQLFHQDTIESINQATQLYVLAYLMLGPRPEIIPRRNKVAPRSYVSLRPYLDAFSNALVSTENAIARQSCVPLRPRRNAGSPDGPSLGTTFYFCIPPNDKLLAYWDLVADRLFKIRHCMNIEGVMRQLPLFEPPIDPALLMRAGAAGLDLNTVLGDINVTLPAYRFNFIVQKALELCAEVKSLGGAMLSALEKRDAESLALLRSTHEIRLLEVVREVKQKQIEEARDTWEGLQKSKEVITLRRDYYAGLLSTFLGLNKEEVLQLANAKQSLTFHEIQAHTDLMANILHLIPNIKVGVPVTMGATFGGHNLGDALRAFSTFMGAQANILNSAGAMSGTVASYQRRADEWRHQRRLAEKELEQIEKQIAAADIRRQVTALELENHDKQVENAKAVDEYMRSKFTNRELYDWMTSQIAALYFQTYQLACDIAKRAEKAYRFERGLTSSNFIQFGYWDGLKKGLLAGERLHLDLKRLEMAYLDQNKREYEITKNISLLLLDPLALVTLRETGECEFRLPEELFDHDYPGHYMRRIKSISITIPCVTGPYTNINCTLTLLSNKIRIKNNPSQPYVEGDEDNRFVTNFAAVQSVTTSHAQNDSGLFELNFRDERYLPFEGAGATSHWRIEMPRECNHFDFNTISDVLLHLKYTARDGGETLKRDAIVAVIKRTPAVPRTGVRLFSARHEFASEWYRFMNPPVEALDQRLELRLTQEHFPFLAQAGTLGISKFEIFLLIKERRIYEGARSPYASAAPLKMSISPPESLALAVTTDEMQLIRNEMFGDVPYRSITLTGQALPAQLVLKSSEGDLRLIADDLKHIVTVESISHTRLRADAIEDILVACHYSVT